MGSPVRLSTTSMRMTAPHLALRVSPERYLPAKVVLQRLWGVCLHSSQWASRQPRLLQAAHHGRCKGPRGKGCAQKPALGLGADWGRVSGCKIRLAARASEAHSGCDRALHASA